MPIFRKLFFSKPILTLVGPVLLCLQMVNAQQIWLQRSDGKVISSYDTVVMQTFFEKHSFTVRSLEPIPEESEIFVLLFYKDSLKPTMALKADDNVLPKYLSSYLAEAPKHTRVNIFVQLKNKLDSTRSYAQLTFTLLGNPLGMAKPVIIRNQKIWLENYARKKITEKDSIITPEFWKSKKVLIKTAVPMGVDDKIWCIINPEIGEAKAYSWTTELWSKDMIEALDNAPHGTRLQIVLQVAVSKRDETLPKQLNLRIVK